MQTTLAIQIYRNVANRSGANILNAIVQLGSSYTYEALCDLASIGKRAALTDWRATVSEATSMVAARWGRRISARFVRLD